MSCVWETKLHGLAEVADEGGFCAAVQSAADKTSSRNQAQPRAMTQRVVPLFETLDDLNNAGATLQRLLDTPWYRQQLRYGSARLPQIRTSPPHTSTTSSYSQYSQPQT